MADAQGQLDRAEFWQRVAAFALTALASVIGFGSLVVRDSVNDVIRDNKTAREAFVEYVRAMERRVTLIEERQDTLRLTAREHDGRIDMLEAKRIKADR